MFHIRQHIVILAVILMTGLSWAMESPPASSNPYTPIIDRNIFNLVPMPTNDPAANAKPPEPPVKITPNGIMTIFGQLQVIFKVATPTKPGAPAQDHSYVMNVGERQDDIEVTKIDEASRTITFNNHGIVQELSLTNASIATPAAPTGPGPAFAPNMPPRPGFGRPLGNPSLQPPGAGRNFANPAGNSPGSNPNIFNPNAPTGQNLSGNNVGAEGNITPETQALLIEAQRQKYQAEGSPIANMLPPTPLTKQLQEEAAQNQQ